MALLIGTHTGSVALRKKDFGERDRGSGEGGTSCGTELPSKGSKCSLISAKR